MLVVQCETGLTGGVLEKNKKGLLDQHSSSEPGQNGETVMTITEAEHTSHKSTFEDRKMLRFGVGETPAKGCLLSCWTQFFILDDGVGRN